MTGDSTTLPNLAQLLAAAGPPPPRGEKPAGDGPANPPARSPAHEVLADRLLPPPFPNVGDSLGDFLLLTELGRGAVGRVYLAAQQGVAGRPVVLKVTPISDVEYLSLGRLQHTHIIPLHCVHEYPTWNLRALSQPYFGGATLSRILTALGDVPASRRTGQSLVDALDRSSTGPPLPMPPSGGPRVTLQRLSYVEAICWIASCLAEALHHAHERGLIHLDLKPSNVLLAADGQPLLLDFHLAHASMAAGQRIPLTLGGTPGYMSPEQKAAYDAVYRSQTLPRALGRESDIYSLGRLLYVALGGSEKESIDDPPPLRKRNPIVSRGLEDIVRRCLAPDPVDRYRSGAELAADLRRHLADQPLRGVPNRSLAERWSKLRRRRPFAPLWAGLALAMVAFPLFVAGTIQERIAEGRESLHTGREFYQAHQYAEAARSFAHGKSRLANVPGCGDLREHLDQSFLQADRAAAAERLHNVADRLRFMVGVDLNTTKELEALDADVHAAWEKRSLFADRSTLDTRLAEQVRIDLADVASLRTDLAQRLDPEAAPIAVAPEALLAVRSDEWWRHADAGRKLMCERRHDEAAAEFALAAELRPQDFWIHFYSGVCAYRSERGREAVNAFTVALALAPETSEVRYNRGLAHLKAGDVSAAGRDFARAIALNPSLARRDNVRVLVGR